VQYPPPPPPGSPYQYAQPQYPQYPGYQYMPPAPTYGAVQKSRTAYIVLGIFLGALGIHNFYGGYTGRAVGQLCLTVLTLGYLGIVSWIWAIVEICIVDKDSAGIPFS
jgi:TM2 domain-containing membrane protein YozV